MQLPDYFLEEISSIGDAELNKLYSKFCREKGETDLIEFGRHLYLKDLISADDLKKVQIQEKIDFNSINELWNDEGSELNSENKGSSKAIFTILESIDEGAMGEILIAKDNELGRTVAYKRIHSHVAEYPSFLKRFYMEAKITAQLQHPNIVPVYALRAIDDEIGYAMKLIQGKTLKDLIEETKEQLNKKNKTDEHHSQAALLDHFLKVCDALHYAHRKGVVHRDLKPLNIMVGPYNEVYVMDWGVAKLVDVDKETFEDKTELIDSDGHRHDDDKTTIGELLGTPVYMSPEQATGANDIVDHRSDIFSLALILFELITLKRALAGKNQLETIERASSATLNEPVPYSKHLHVPNQLLAIIEKATKKDPADRYATTEEFANDIRRYIRGETISARPDNLKHKIIRWMNKHRVATLNVVAYSVLASIFAISWSLYQQQNANMETQLQSQHLSQFISAVSKQAQIVDTQFIKYEGIVQGVASSAVTLLEVGHPDESQFYDHKDFADSQSAPPDLADSPVYGFPISVDWHAVKLAPDVEYAQVEKIVRTINPLRHTFKRLVLKSHPTPITADNDEMVSRIIKDEGLPLVWAFVGLKEGIHASYPGKTTFPTDYDPRQRPWYLNTLSQEDNSCWMTPYIDSGGRGVLLPCTSKLYNNEGQFLGVAAVEMTLEYIRRELMTISELKGVENTYLLNEDAAIIVDSSESAKSYEAGTLVNSIDNLKLYPNKRIALLVRSGESGYTSLTENGRKKFISYVKLNSIGWYYLAVADALNVESVVEIVAN